MPDKAKDPKKVQKPLSNSKNVNREVASNEAVVSRNAVAKEGKIIRDGKEVTSKDVLYKGTVRVVTEADIQNDPRLVAASVVAGQLYDFSNLPSIPDGSVEANVEGYNAAHEEAAENRVAKADKEKTLLPFTSEEQRVKMEMASKEELSARDKADEEARARVEKRRNG